MLRSELLKLSNLRTKLPLCVRVHRKLGEFWPFIKNKFDHYSERREFLHNEFAPAINYLEELELQSPVSLAATSVLIVVDSEHVQDAWNKALERRLSDPEGAITASRTLLESVCKFILDEIGQPYDNDGDLPKLYKLTAQQLNLSPGQHEEQIFKQILGGVTSVVDGLGSLRNKLSDAHGKGKSGSKPKPRHAQLAVHLAGAVATFLIETWEAKSKV